MMNENELELLKKNEEQAEGGMKVLSDEMLTKVIGGEWTDCPPPRQPEEPELPKGVRQIMCEANPY